MLRSRPQSSADDIQHITAIVQRNGAEQGKVAEDEGFTLDRAPHGQVLHHLRDGADSVVGSGGQDVQWCVGVDEKGGHVVAVAGQRHEAVVGMGDWLFVRAWVAAVRGSRKLRYSKLSHAETCPAHSRRKRSCGHELSAAINRQR